MQSELFGDSNLNAESGRQQTDCRIENFPKLPFCVEVAAEFAEFTGKKDQRTSYPVPTSGAVRGFLESFFWKPAVKYIPRAVEVLKPIRRMDIKKNELKQGFKGDFSPVSIEEDRIQRNNSYLRDVLYRIHCDLVFIPSELRKEFYKGYQSRNEQDENPMKYYEMLKRRIRKGQYCKSPYLGTRECVCSSVEWIDDAEAEKTNPIDQTGDLGMMYVDYIYNEDYNPEQRARMLKIVSMENGGKSNVDKGFSPRPVSARIGIENGVVRYPSKYDLLDEMLQKMEKFWMEK